MQLHRRLQRLEVRTHVAVEHQSPQTDREWLAAFREFGRKGLSRREPDFVRALAEYEAVIERLERESANDRTQEVQVAFTWLAEMMLRPLSSVPPASIAEFEALANWFTSLEPELIAWERRAGQSATTRCGNTSLHRLRFGNTLRPRA